MFAHDRHFIYKFVLRTQVHRYTDTQTHISLVRCDADTQHTATNMEEMEKSPHSTVENFSVSTAESTHIMTRFHLGFEKLVCTHSTL